MQKQNERQRAKRKKKEYRRLRKLTEQAEARDPRLRRWAEKEAELKRRAAAAAEAEAARIAAEKARLAAEEAERKAAEDARLAEERAAARAAKGALKKRLRQLRKRIRNVLSSLMDADDLEALLRETKEELPLATWAEAAESDSAAAVELVQTEIERRREEAAAARAAEAEAARKLKEERAARAAEAKAAKMAAAEPWLPDELAHLSRAFARFPGGSRSRWKQITDYVNGNSGKDRSQEEVIAMARKMNSSKAGAAPSAFEQFASQRGVLKPSRDKGGVAIPSEDAAPAPAAAKSAPDSGAADGKKTASKRRVKRKRTKKRTTKTGKKAAAGGAAAAAAPAAAPAAGKDVWSIEQQQALGKALKTYPAGSMSLKERWQSIGAAVPGKTAKQCLARFKAIRAKLSSK
eukprot:PLAT7043.15.p2 GENE.PLAT7043.15~~PLAT7043.15.p2  ORF type:complete len:406 (-),score=195.33 PLAT7043.15:1501-2718(-)